MTDPETPTPAEAARMMAERAARGDPEAAIRILDETSPSVPPDPGDELE